VRYVSRKPPAAWKGTRAEHLIGLEKCTRAIEIFNGNARDAALQFPQNANVAAAIALSGIGFEKTEVTLIADPQARGNEHSILAEGVFGRAEVHVAGNPLPQNPKTSWLAALSLARAVLNSRARVII
jgi:aspartate dehydrogenase